MNTKLLSILAALAAGALGGFAIGRGTAPTAAAPSNAPLGNSAIALASGSLSPENATGSTQALTPSQGVAPKPITAAELQDVFAVMEAPGYRGASDLRKMADLQDRLKVSDLASIAATLCASATAPNRMSGFFLVMSTYAEQDPQAAWNLALGIKGALRQNALSVIISAMAARDPSRAIAMADGIGEPQLKRQLRSAAIMNIAQKDPQKALSLALDGKGGDEGDFPVSMIFHNWARKDLEGAKAAIGRLSGRQADQARQALFSALAQQDPKAAWDYALTMPPAGEIYQDARIQVVQQWAQTDPQAALKAALSISDTRLRGPAMSSAINSWARSDFSGALKYAVSVDDSTLRADLLQNLSGSSQGNRKELLGAVLDHMPPGDSFRNAVSNLFSSWARENPTEAAAAVSQLPAGSVFSNAASQIASQWVRNAANKREVFDWARTLPEGEARNNSLSSVFGEWSSSDPQGALKALDSLSPEDRKTASRALASGWSRNSPEAALRWASTMADAGERSSTVQMAVSQWANTAPDAAARYVERLPEAERSGPMQAVLNSWASKDTEAAAAWLDKQAPGPSKDGALRALSRKIAQEDPEAALTWVAGITDEKERLRQTENIAREWVRQDPAVARSWISTSKLPEETRNKLLK
ncbi:MAG: hypothetical protein WC076_00230 [Terrimicrobiaceae bacterium]|nr:hypothetical protein [Terrimicrobiaceae bacterium]